MKSVEFIEKILANAGVVADQVFDEVLNIDFEGYENKSGNSWAIVFKNCVFNFQFKFKNLQFAHGDLSFESCQFLGETNYSIEDVYLNYLSFSNCVLPNLIIRKSDIDYTDISNCSSDGRLRLFYIKGSYFKIDGYNQSVFRYIKMHCPDLETVDIVNTNPIKELEIGDCQDLTVSSPVQKLNILADDFKNITIESRGIENVYRVQELQFTNSNFDGALTIQDVNIEKLNLSALNSTRGVLRLNEVKLWDVIFSELSINKMYWHHIVFNNPPSIEKCDLSGLHFTYINWKGGKEVADSYLHMKIPMFARFRDNEEDKEFDIMDIEYERDTYRQFKAAAIANHNHVEALDFYRFEMRLLWKEYRITGGNSWQDFVLVFINRWTSDFGQNWVMPLFWLLVATFFYYCAWEKPEFGCGWNNFKNGFFDMISYLNPFKLKGNSVDNIDKVAIGKDFLFKALAGYFIYHFLKASRKFGRV